MFVQKILTSGYPAINSTRSNVCSYVQTHCIFKFLALYITCMYWLPEFITLNVRARFATARGIDPLYYCL